MTNSCASYVHNRAGPAIVDQVAQVDLTSEISQMNFVDSFDGFVTKSDDCSKENLYHLSEQSVKDFQEVLTRFSGMLQTRKAFKKLAITIREPQDFDLNYILNVARRISESRDDPGETGICERFINRCYQKAAENDDVVKGLISLAPTDIYGSLITGGFTIILAAVENHEKLRVKIQETLAKLPSKLEQVTEISGIQIKRARLHKCADQVFVSIFTVLERIIEKLTRDWKEKIKFTFKSNGGSIEDTFQDLDKHIAEFNHEAGICAQLRMGRVEENGQEVKVIVQSIKELLDGTKLTLDETSLKQDTMEGNILKAILDGREDNAILRQQLAGALNLVYRFMASNPVFDSLNGTVDRQYLRQNAGIEENPSESLAGESRMMINAWLQALGEFVPSSDHHIKHCLNQAGSLDTHDQDKTQYIMKSEAVRNWLAKPATEILEVRPETAPSDLFNSISLATSMLALALSGSTNFAVLSFFCGLRKNESPMEGDSGLMGILKSLNGQLLKYIIAKQPSIRLGIQKVDKVWGESRKDPKYAKALFKKLLSLLPDGCVVFILFDSVSRVFGDKMQIDDLVRSIFSFATQQADRVIIKLLVTDPLASSRSIRSLGQVSIYVPDDVDGWNCGMNTTLLNQDTRMNLQRLQAEQRSDRETSLEDSNDTQSEYDSFENDTGS